LSVERARPAVAADLAAVHELLTVALAGTRTMRGGAALMGDQTPEELVARWTARGEAGVGLFVGEFHQAVVGVAAATTCTRAGSGGPARPTGRIECCYVEEGARGVGVGSALMDALVTWCGKRGCGDIDALALPGDRSSKQRLEAAGFTARLLTLNRQLD
jgi:GNAT superfamily N-acetyltransferase